MDFLSPPGSINESSKDTKSLILARLKKKEKRFAQTILKEPEKKQNRYCRKRCQPMRLWETRAERNLIVLGVVRSVGPVCRLPLERIP